MSRWGRPRILACATHEARDAGTGCTSSPDEGRQTAWSSDRARALGLPEGALVLRRSAARDDGVFEARLDADRASQEAVAALYGGLGLHTDDFRIDVAGAYANVGATINESAEGCEAGAQIKVGCAGVYGVESFFLGLSFSYQPSGGTDSTRTM